MPAIRIRPATPADWVELAALRHALWPESPESDHLDELAAILAGRWPGTLPGAIFVAEQDGELTGFLETGLRSHAEGCDPAHPAGYVEGWYVAPAHRRHGIAARLLEAAEAWARSQGCTEMASGARLDDVDSQRVHESLGFEAVERSVQYRKPL